MPPESVSPWPERPANQHRHRPRQQLPRPERLSPFHTAGCDSVAMCMCRAACRWPGAPATAMIITQTDQLSGMRSANREFSVARVSTTQNGRAATMALVDKISMSAVAAATNASALRDAHWALPASPALQATPETIGQIQSAAVVDSEAALVAVLTHVGVSAHAFVLHVSDEGAPCRAVGAVLTQEDSLQVSSPSRAPMHYCRSTFSSSIH